MNVALVQDFLRKNKGRSGSDRQAGIVRFFRFFIQIFYYPDDQIFLIRITYGKRFFCCGLLFDNILTLIGSEYHQIMSCINIVDLLTDRRRSFRQPCRLFGTVRNKRRQQQQKKDESRTAPLGNDRRCRCGKHKK